MKKSQIFSAGILKENPALMMFLGMCPMLATTTSIDNAFGMGLAVIFVLVMSNIVVSAVRKIVPNEIRIPVYIIIIATFVKCVDLVMNAFTPDLYASLGLFIPLIVVNCVILGRAEAFASKNTVVDSIIDGLGMGIGFTLALFLIALIRQLFGTGSLVLHNPLNPAQVWFNLTTPLTNYAIPLLTQPAGAFLVLGIVVAAITAIKTSAAKKAEAKAKKAEAAAKAN